MSKFRRRLGARRDAPRGGLGEVTAEAVTPDIDERPQTALRLERLRAALAHACGTPPPPVRVVPETTLPPLEESPFGRIEGVYTRRRRPGHPSVGRVPMDWAAQADASWLARMALDGTLGDVSLHDALFLDTETTGLGGGTGNIPFLVGLAWFEDGAPQLEQLWLRDLDEEPEMLERLRERLAEASVLVTYNGKSFDWPVLKSRYLMNGLAVPPERPHLDLLHLARRVHKGRAFRKSLTELERRILGYRRGPDVGGEEVAQRYLAYLRTGDAAPLGEVVVHNERDIWSLLALTGLYGAPLDRLAPEDLPWLARCVRRAGDLPRAGRVAELAVSRGAGLEALRAQGEIAKACGAKDEAIAAFEAAEPLASCPIALAEIRLELAKLYEHHRRDPARALDCLDRARVGTAQARWVEAPEAAARRRDRLQRKRRRRKPGPTQSAGPGPRPKRSAP